MFFLYQLVNWLVVIVGLPYCWNKKQWWESKSHEHWGCFADKRRRGCHFSKKHWCLMIFEQTQITQVGSSINVRNCPNKLGYHRWSVQQTNLPDANPAGSGVATNPASCPHWPIWLVSWCHAWERSTGHPWKSQHVFFWETGKSRCPLQVFSLKGSVGFQFPTTSIYLA